MASKGEYIRKCGGCHGPREEATLWNFAPPPPPPPLDKANSRLFGGTFINLWKKERARQKIFGRSKKGREGSQVYLLPAPPQEGEKRDAQPTGPSSALDCVYFYSFFISLTLEEGREEKLALNNNFFKLTPSPVHSFLSK